jgi:hypothetical protein
MERGLAWDGAPEGRKVETEAVKALFQEMRSVVRTDRDLHEKVSIWQREPPSPSLLQP